MASRTASSKEHECVLVILFQTNTPEKTRLFICRLFNGKDVDCKTVRIFAYSNTREQSNKKSGTRLKTESGIYYFLPSVIRRPSSAVSRLPFVPLPSPAFLSEMVRSATQYCLCWSRMLTVSLKKGPI